MQIERREFLRLMGGLSAAVVVGGVGLDQVIEVPDQLIERAKNGPGFETWKNTVCGQCPAGCGLRIRLIDEIPVYIKGNPVYPVNQGGMCPLGHSSLEVLFNPDRVKGPMRRIGPPGAGRWEPAEWSEALSMVTDRLAALRNVGTPERVAFLGSDERGLMRSHIQRFMQAYGSPNYFQIPSLQRDAIPNQLTMGRSELPAYDLPNARVVVSFGANYLEEGYAPVYYTKLFSHMRELTDGSRVRFIQVEPRLSMTAAKADRWIPIRPGTYGALALGIAHVLIREALFDSEFVRTRTFGFEDSQDRSGRERKGYKSVVLDSYYPERVSEITGVPSATILEIAREIGNNQPSVVVGGNGVLDNANGTYELIAVQSLNALLGNFEQPGGIFFPTEPPFASLPPVEEDETARAGLRSAAIGGSLDGSFPLTEFAVSSFVANVLSGRPYPLEVLFIYHGNTLFQALEHHELAEALARIPLVVDFDSFINETGEYADLILPDHTFLEKWDEISQAPSVGFSHVGIQQPVIEPIYDTRHTADVLTDLSRALGGSVAASLPFDTYVEQIQHRLRGVYESGEGAIASEGIQGSWLEYLQQRGWHLGRYASFDAFWKELQKSGGWWNPIRSDAGVDSLFRTPSGSYEFLVQTLEEALTGLAASDNESVEMVLDRLGVEAQADVAFLPHHEPIRDQSEELPLHLITYQPLTNRGGHGANQPMMQEMFGYAVRQYWRSWVEINPATASSYGIRDGDWVWVQSTIGSLRVQARLTPGIMPEVVCIPFGLGHTAYGRYAAGHGVNPNSIILGRYDALTGRPALQATKVNISVTA